MERNKRKNKVGRVIASSSSKTVAVLVERRFRHPRYNKVNKVMKKYQVHNENMELKIGDIVQITETRPISKTKNWRVSKIIESKK